MKILLLWKPSQQINTFDSFLCQNQTTKSDRSGCSCLLCCDFVSFSSCSPSSIWLVELLSIRSTKQQEPFRHFNHLTDIHLKWNATFWRAAVATDVQIHIKYIYIFILIYLCVYLYIHMCMCVYDALISGTDLTDSYRNCWYGIVSFNGAALQSRVQKKEPRRKEEFHLQQIEHTDSRRITILSWFLASLQRRRTRGARGGGGQSSSREEQRGRSENGGREEEEQSERREAEGRATGEGDHGKEDGHKLAGYRRKSRSSAGGGWMRSSWRASGDPGDGGWRALQPFPAAAGRITPRRGKYGVFLFLLHCLLSTISTLHFGLPACGWSAQLSHNLLSLSARSHLPLFSAATNYLVSKLIWLHIVRLDWIHKSWELCNDPRMHLSQLFLGMSWFNETKPCVQIISFRLSRWIFMTNRILIVSCWCILRSLTAD